MMLAIYLICKKIAFLMEKAQLVFLVEMMLYYALNMWLFSVLILNIFNRVERQRREDELKNRSSKKSNNAEQAILNRVSF